MTLSGKKRTLHPVQKVFSSLCDTAAFKFSICFLNALVNPAKHIIFIIQKHNDVMLGHLLLKEVPSGGTTLFFTLLLWTHPKKLSVLLLFTITEKQIGRYQNRATLESN